MKIVLAYSGGLDTSIILRWLKDNYSAEIIAFCADIGQEEELHGLEKKALRTGASKCYIDDLQEEFARDFIFPMSVRARFTKISISRDQHRAAAHRQAHGRNCASGKGECHRTRCHGKGNDQVRFDFQLPRSRLNCKSSRHGEKSVSAKQFPGRAEMIAFAKANQIDVTATAEKSYSMDRNHSTSASRAEFWKIRGSMPVPLKCTTCIN